MWVLCFVPVQITEVLKVYKALLKSLPQKAVVNLAPIGLK